MAWVSEMLRSVLDNDKKALRVEVVGGGNGGGNMEDFYKKEEVDSKLDEKVDNSRVLTDVPKNAKFTDTNTITTIGGKTGAITKVDIVNLGIPAQDTVYSPPTSYPASMIEESTTKRFVSDAEKASWNSKVDQSVIDALVARIEALENI